MWCGEEEEEEEGEVELEGSESWVWMDAGHEEGRYREGIFG